MDIIESGLTEGGVLDSFYQTPILYTISIQQGDSISPQAIGAQGYFLEVPPPTSKPVRLNVAAVGTKTFFSLTPSPHPQPIAVFTPHLSERHAEDEHSRHGDGFGSHIDTTGLGSLLSIPFFPSPLPPSDYHFLLSSIDERGLPEAIPASSTS